MIDTLSIGSRFLVEGVEGASAETPLSLPVLQQLILDGKLLPEHQVREETRRTGSALSERADLVPFGRLRARIVQLYRDRREGEALDWIRLFEGLDPSGSQKERVHVRFIQALICERLEPATAVGLYESLLSVVDQSLHFVVHNNLAVLRFRDGELSSALEHVRIALEATEPVMAALLNHQVIVQHAVDSTPEALSGTLEDTRRGMLERLAEVERTIGRAADDDDLLGQLTRQGPLPAEECATLLAPDQLPERGLYVPISQDHRDLGRECLARARRALSSEHWVDARVWAAEAARRGHGDATFTTEVDRIRRIADDRQRTADVRSNHERYEVSLRKVRDLEAQGRIREAFEQVEALERVAAAEASEDERPGLEHELGDLKRRLRVELADIHFAKTSPGHTTSRQPTAAPPAPPAPREDRVAAEAEERATLAQRATGVDVEADAEPGIEPEAEPEPWLRSLTAVRRVLKALEDGEVGRAFRELLTIAREDLSAPGFKYLVGAVVLEGNAGARARRRIDLLEKNVTDAAAVARGLDRLGAQLGEIRTADPAALVVRVEASSVALDERVDEAYRAFRSGRRGDATDLLAPLASHAPVIQSALSVFAAAELDEQVTSERTRATLTALVDQAFDALEQHALGLAHQKFQHAQRAAPHLEVPERMLASIVARAEDRLNRCEAALAHGDASSATLSIQVFSSDWGDYARPQHLTDRATELERAIFDTHRNKKNRHGSVRSRFSALFGKKGQR